MRMRPLWLTENYPPDRGGMAQSCDRIVHALQERGIAIDVAHVSRRYSDWRVETKAGGKQICCPADEDPAHTLNRLWSMVKSETPTHVVAFGGTLPLLAGPPFAAWLGCPLITLLRGNDFDAAIFSPKKSDVLRNALLASTAICTVTKDHADRIGAMVHALPRWIPNGVDAADWQLMPHDREEGARWRAANVAPGRRLLGIFGQLKRKKGVQWFLQTLERSGHASRFHVLLAGDVEELPASDAIATTVLPFRDRYELLPLFAACDAVVVPSFYDGLPNVVLEAAALGVPLVASNAGGIADVLTGGQNAIVFEAGDEHDCRRAIFEAASIPDEALRQLGARARDLVIEEFSADREAQQYVDLLFETAPNVRRLEVAYEKP
jgi:glycosyltransferase involved in cell wall biosynthesis